MKRFFGICLSMGFGLSSTGAFAEPEPKKEQGYEYRFEDDRLLSPGKDGTIPYIQVLKTGRRDRLLRPRTQFVTEMLKSVESM